MAVRIPDGQKAALKKLAVLPDDSFKRLCSALETAKPQMTMAGLARQITKALDPRVAEARDILGLVMSLETARLQRRVDVAGIVADLVEAATSSDVFPEEEAKAGAIENLQTRMSALLSAGDAIELTTRIADVYLSHAKLFRRARILSDIRPVFGVDSIDEPQVGAIVHNLAITTENATGTDADTPYIAMNIHDLRELKQVVERALLKDDVLRRTIASTGMTYVEDDPLEHQQ